MLRIWMLAIVSILVSGCAIAPKNLASCGFVRRELAVSDPGRPSSGTLAESIGASLRDTRPSRPPGEARGSMLFMSGGGQNGAFGAGFLDGWKARRDGKLPTFSVVTGISTGAILATFAFVDQPDRAVNGYTIVDERQLLTPFARASGGKLGLSTGVTLLRRGAIADLQPLRTRLSENLPDSVLGAVAIEFAKKRQLHVGAVDVDTGQAVAFDLGEMAARWNDEGDANRRAHWKACYIEAIVASSSAPIAATPVFIDNHMYVDGGLRFGVFSDELGKVIKDRVSPGGLPEPPPTTYVLINGDQLIDPTCGTEPECSATNPAPGNLADNAHRKWNFFDLALRSESILVNQIYRFSADRIAAQTDAGVQGFTLIKIEPAAQAHPADLGESGVDAGSHDCAYWRRRDRELLNPLQFYPRYMRCLISYGRTRAMSDDW